jgi:outer membrane protein TolC
LAGAYHTDPEALQDKAARRLLSMGSCMKNALYPSIAVVVVLLAASPFRVSAQSGSAPLTLSSAVAEALRKNDQILDQNDSEERSTLALRFARNAFLPKVTPNIVGSFGQTNIADQQYQVDVTQKFTNGTSLQAGVGTSTAQVPQADGQDLRYYNTDTTFLINQPLLRGFGRAVARRPLTAAEFKQADSRRQRTLAEQHVTVDVAGAYYRIVAQDALVNVAQQSVDRASRLRDASEAKLTAGLVSQLDVLRARQLVSEAELQLLDAQSAREDARDQLRFLVGRDAGAPIDVVTDMPTVPESIDLDQAITAAMASRLDLQSARAAMEDAESAVNYSRNFLKPQVDVNLLLTRRQTAQSLFGSLGVDGYQLATFMNISTPVDRTPAQIDYQNALVDRDRSRRQVDLVARRIRDDVTLQIRQRDRIRRSLQTAESTVAIARQELDVARERYERGLSNNLDVVTAETNLRTAESRRILTLGDMAVNWLSLRATMGVLDPMRDTLVLSESR